MAALRSGAHRRRRIRLGDRLSRPLALARRLPRPRRRRRAVPAPSGPGHSRTTPSPRRAPRAPRERLSLEGRRSRALLMASVLFAGLVLGVALPWSTLLGQRAQMSSASAELAKLEAENRVLSLQTRQLADSATQAALAREDYGLVSKGQTGYEDLPAPGSGLNTKVGAGQVPLDQPPVVPGSTRSEELLAGNALTLSPSTAAVHGAPSRSGGSASAGGFWSRVVHTLEFWT